MSNPTAATVAAAICTFTAEPTPRNVERWDAPLLLIGLAGVAAGDAGVAFESSCYDGERAVVPGSIVLVGPTWPADATVNIELTDETGDTAPAPAPCGVEVDDGSWRAISGLAARTYAPASETSRLTGAGAGPTDDD